MISASSVNFEDREHAGQLLGKKLRYYEKSNAVVVGIPNGGVCVAAAIAAELCLPLELMPSRKIEHPAFRGKSIGAVTTFDVFINDYAYDIPQDYIYHQITMLKNALQYEHHFYYEDSPPASFANKIVILVDDVLQCGDTIIACLRGIKKQNPDRIIVAGPVISLAVAHAIKQEGAEVISLRMEPVVRLDKSYFIEFPPVDSETVRNLFIDQKKALQE